MPVIGDWNGDGYDEIGIYRPDHEGNSYFFLITRHWNDLSERVGEADKSILFGPYPENIPITGDWDGDGDDDVGGFYSSNCVFYLYKLNLGASSVTALNENVNFGEAGDLPIIGDWNGDKKDDLGIMRENDPCQNTNTFHFYLRLNGHNFDLDEYEYQNTIGKPIIGDWDGDGDDNIGVYNPSNNDFKTKSDAPVLPSPPGTPSISSSTHPNQNIPYKNNDPSFRWTTPSTSSGIAGYSYILDHSSSTIPDTTVETTGTSKSYSNQADGTWYFHIKAKDSMGTWGSTDYYRIKIDSTPPSPPSPDDEVSGPNEDTTPTFSWNAPSDSSGIAGYYYKVDSGSDQWTTSRSVTLPVQQEGIHTFYVKAQDQAENWGNYGSHQFEIRETDNTAPSVIISSPSGGENWECTTDHYIFWTATDNKGVTSIDISYSTDGGSTWKQVTTSEPNDGSYQWTVPSDPSENCRIKLYFQRCMFFRYQAALFVWA